VTDIATLVLKADTRQLKEAAKDLGTVKKAGADAGRQADEDAKRFMKLYDEMFPGRAKAREHVNNLQAINEAHKRGIISAEDHAAMTKRLNDEAAGANEGLSKLAKIGIAAVITAAGAAAAALVKMTRSAINTADEMMKASQSIGIGVEELSRLRYAAELSGVSFGGLKSSLNIMNRNLVDLSGKGNSATKALAKMGIEARSADGKLRSSTDILKDMADVFQRMPDGAEKSALAMAVLGRSGAEMIPLLNGGADAMNNLLKEANQFGIVIDERTGRKAEQFNDDLSRLKTMLQGVALQIASDLLPKLIDFQNWLIKNQDAIVGAIMRGVEFIGTLARMAQALAPLIAGAMTYRVALVALTAAKAAFTAAVGAATLATRGLTAALMPNPFGAVAVVLGTLAGAFVALANSQRQARVETDNLIRSLKGLAQARSTEFFIERRRAELQSQSIQNEIKALNERKRRIQSSPELSQRAGSPSIVRGIDEEIRILTRRRFDIDAGITAGNDALRDAERAAASIVVPAALAADSLDKVSKASGRGGAASGLRETRDELTDLIERLFPEFTTRAQMAQMELLRIGEIENRISSARRVAGIERIFGGKPEVSRDLMRDARQFTKETGDIVAKEYKRMMKDIAKFGAFGKKTTKDLGDSFYDMSNRVLGALNQLAMGIKHGGFLGILSGVLNLFLQLGSVGAFGKTLATNINRAPTNASRGANAIAGKPYMVGERGPEVFVPGASGAIVPNNAMGGQKVHVTVGVDPANGNITAFVNDQIVATAPAIAQAGAGIAQAQMAQSARRRVR
jgi:hypothetical protein